VIVGLYEGASPFLSPKKKDLKWFDGGSGAPGRCDFRGVAGHQTTRAYARTSPESGKGQDVVIFPTASRFYFKTIVPPKEVDVHFGSAERPRTHRPPPIHRRQGVPSLTPFFKIRASRRRKLRWRGNASAPRALLSGNDLQEETETDLFGEQTVLCGGLTALTLGRLRNVGGSGLPSRRWLISNASTN